MKIKRWKEYEKNTLRGFVDVELPSGMILKSMTWHQKDDSEWIGLPAKEYIKDDGSKSYSNLVDFKDRNLYYAFCDQVIGALKEHIGETPNQNDDDDTPF